MSFKVTDKVVYLRTKHASIDQGRKGTVLDLKYNLILIAFDDTGERDWVDAKHVKYYG
jgi:hypothetical protein